MRKRFVEEKSAAQIADQFGYSIASVNHMVTMVRAGRMRLFADARPPRLRSGKASPRGPASALATELCGVRLSSPLMLASGGLGESARTLRPYQRASVGAVVTRTLRIRGAPPVSSPAPARRRGWRLPA